MAVTIPNTSRIRATSDSSVVDALQQLAQYVNRNVTPAAGTRVAPPAPGSRPINPVRR
jgi:hypothetical protein